MTFIHNYPYWSLTGLLVICISIYDVFQKKHTIWRNYPFIGHFRWIVEAAGPPLRQYLFMGDREERPFNRIQRAFIYASAKLMNNLIGFGSNAKQTEDGHVMFLPKTLQRKMKNLIPKPLKIIGPNRRNPYLPQSLINISGMSVGALSGAAASSLNMGAKIAGCYQNTGEGGFTTYHDNGADVVFQIGTAYYGCRNQDGTFSMEKLIALTKAHSCIKMIEIKLSQGAKPGKGGVLPAIKVTPEIAAFRGIEPYTDSISPAYHSAFLVEPLEGESPAQTMKRHVQAMVDFIEQVAEATGLPVGIKTAVGTLEEWHELANIMASTNKGPDFITIDGGEGGTGAAHATLADHMSLLFFDAFPRVYKVFETYGLNKRVTWIGSGKLGLPSRAVQAFAMGIDLVNVAREALLSIGCIQAMNCHNDKCPTGITTHNKWKQRGLVPELKSQRFANYHAELLKVIKVVANGMGREHPYDVTMDQIEIRKGGVNVPQDIMYEYGNIRRATYQELNEYNQSLN